MSKKQKARSFEYAPYDYDSGMFAVQKKKPYVSADPRQLAKRLLTKADPPEKEPFYFLLIDTTNRTVYPYQGMRVRFKDPNPKRKERTERRLVTLVLERTEPPLRRYSRQKFTTTEELEEYIEEFGAAMRDYLAGESDVELRG